MFKQMIVNFGKLFSFFCSFHLYPFAYFIYIFLFFYKLLSIALKRKKQNKKKTNIGFKGKKSKFESSLFYVTAMWVRSSWFVTVRPFSHLPSGVILPRICLRSK